MIWEGIQNFGSDIYLPPRIYVVYIQKVFVEVGKEATKLGGMSKN